MNTSRCRLPLAISPTAPRPTLPAVSPSVRQSPTRNEWSPRIGFAYSPGKDGCLVHPRRFQPGFRPDLREPHLECRAAVFPADKRCGSELERAELPCKNGGLPAVSYRCRRKRRALAVVGSYTFGGKRPYGLTWTLGVQRVLGKNYTVEARYRENQGRPPLEPDAPEYLSPRLPRPVTSPLLFDALRSHLCRSDHHPGATAGHHRSRRHGGMPYNALASLGSQANIVAICSAGLLLLQRARSAAEQTLSPTTCRTSWPTPGAI